MSLKRLLLAVAFARLALADGGTPVFTQEQGAYLVMLFSSPEPVRVGMVDLSVLVERAADRAPVFDAQVVLDITRTGFNPIRVAASHAEATNQLLYAARVVLPAEGTWRVAVNVSSKEGTARVSGELRTLPPSAPLEEYWPYFALVPLGIVLFVLNQSLKRRRARPQARA